MFKMYNMMIYLYMHILFPFFFFCLFLLCFWLCGIVIAAHRLSLVAVSVGYSLIAVHGLLISVASLVAEHRL